MFHLHRKALGAGLVTTLTLAVTPAPAALAGGVDLRSPDARDVAAALRPVTDGPSADARHVEPDRRVVGTGPPTWPVDPQPISKPRPAVSASPSGVDWSSAGLGAAALLTAFAIALVGIGALRRRRVTRPGSLTAR
jgi:hypothetical protein